jgi:hypothetical protein
MHVLTITAPNGEHTFSCSEIVNTIGENSVSIYDLWESGLRAIKKKIVFEFTMLELSISDYTAKWSNERKGYILTFEDGTKAYTYFNGSFISRSISCSEILPEKNERLVDNFIDEVNQINYKYS